MAAVALCSVLGSSLAGCSREALPVLPNLRPTIEITHAPVNPTQPFFYGYELRWAGYDPDGYIDHFRYAVDPPTTPDAETTWVRTRENRQSFLFHADSLSSGSDQTAQGYHTIVLQAIDDRGGVSAPAWRSLTSFTIAPSVQITQPPPNPFFHPNVGPSFHLAWTGSDPDGRGTTRPVKYKYRVFSLATMDFDFETLITDPDSLRRRYAPGFSTWDSIGGDTTEVTFRNLTPSEKYMAVVVAFDEAGAYSPVMKQGVNMMYFRVSYDGQNGPDMTVYNESVYYRFGAGWFIDPSTWLRTEVAAGRPVRFNWFGATQGGSFVQGYRWMLDGNIGDEAPRENEDSPAEFKRWSRWSPLTLGVDLAPFNTASASEAHTLYIEAIDNNQLVSLVVVQFTVVRAVFDKALLVVDDTRLLGDRPVPGGCVDRPRGVWPTAAELDTFLYARGGVPWKCYPTGTLSPVGIFAGYDFDTLGTRFLPQGTLTLQQISRYRHIVWLTDPKSGRNLNDPYVTADPMSELRWLSRPGLSNPVATWITQGGQMWMSGGGCATALQLNWEKVAPSDVYASATGELVPGRFMYDLMGWRSEITARSTAQATMPGHPPGRSTSPLDYSGLPAYLFEKRPETDPIAVYAPNRVGLSDFYQAAHVAEGITKPNAVIEDRDPSPGVRFEASVLDTVYESVGGQLGTGHPIMTVYHGGFTGQVQVFSGFQLWYWSRSQQIQILDWVLQRVWKLPRRNVER
jgi:hypothetical protein